MRLRSTNVALLILCLTFGFSCFPPLVVQVTGQTFAAPAKPRVTNLLTPPGEAEEVERQNTWSVGLAGGPVEMTDIRFASDIATALDDGVNLRVIATLTPGSVQNVRDLLYVKGMDAGLVSADVFDELRRDGKIKNIENRIQYVSQVCVSAFQLLANTNVKTLKDLNGKKVAVPLNGSSTSALASKIFDRNGVKVELVPMGIAAGLEQLKSGDVAAVAGAFSRGQPTIFSFIEENSGFHLMPVSFDKFMDEYYVPVSLDNSDYPNLISPGAKVETLGTPIVLAIYNWPKGNDRFRKVERFIKYYFDRFERLRQPPFHPAWRDVNLAAKVPGWTRYWYAEEVLQGLLSKTAADGAKNDKQPQLSRVEQDMLAKLPNEEQKKQLREFFEWKKRQQPQP